MTTLAPQDDGGNLLQRRTGIRAGWEPQAVQSSSPVEDGVGAELAGVVGGSRRRPPRHMRRTYTAIAPGDETSLIEPRPTPSRWYRRRRRRLHRERHVEM